MMPTDSCGCSPPVGVFAGILVYDSGARGVVGDLFCSVLWYFCFFSVAAAVAYRCVDTHVLCLMYLVTYDVLCNVLLRMYSYTLSFIKQIRDYAVD